ncbi:MAG TPA: cob(I)yrinic acid a,c-diamide adenosyltransferase [Methanomicrobia archaeon]|nr:ATP:corrinoid adenosyltransferase [Candidatus Alkanophaga volatiphilum]HDO63098.1 cob(I)yrinic acid a,c-diamide adenosyltransferase [Methanomicrobia archaeon]HEX58691.1 cob(I)yrinic acid a,c-diamide adenosyltransferase [Methanomicrobia archaeon]
MKLEKGCVHVYTGDGKGKTSAALGLALRAIGHGMRVFMVQFIKGIENQEYGEIIAAQRIKNFTVVQFGAGFVGRHAKEVDKLSARYGLKYAKEAMKSGRYDVVILDEINMAVYYGLVDEEAVVELIKSKPEGVELVLTGRYASPKIMELSDYVTEMRMVKHPFEKGLAARKGIEY